MAAGRVSHECHALEKHAARWAGSQDHALQAATEIGKFPSLYLSLFLYCLCRRGHNVLKVQLPSKEEHVILVRLSKIQRALYTEFMNRFRDAGNSGWLGLNPLKAFCVCCKVGFDRSCKKKIVYIYMQRKGKNMDQNRRQKCGWPGPSSPRSVLSSDPAKLLSSLTDLACRIAKHCVQIWGRNL